MTAHATSLAEPMALLRVRYRRSFVALLVYAGLVVAATIALFPVFWMASSSLKPGPELFARDMTLLPVNWTLENYRNVWNNTSFRRYFWNSFQVAALSTILRVIISMYAAYALARDPLRRPRRLRLS
jgi:ABC-type glycerol-3-phosphate transport system permease component